MLVDLLQSNLGGVPSHSKAVAEQAITEAEKNREGCLYKYGRRSAPT